MKHTGNSPLSATGSLKLTTAAVFLFINTLLYSQNLELDSFFNNSMVLQRNCPVPIWGDASPGADVTVTFNGQNKQCKADKNGHWQLSLDPMEVLATGEPLTVSSGGEQKTFTDVVVGDVWVCTGQSNMDYTVSSFWGPRSNPAAVALSKIASKTNDPLLRQYAVPYAISHEKRKKRTDATHHRNNEVNDRLKGNSGLGVWLKATSKQSITAFSGTGFCFAIELRKAMPDVPIGLIKCAWGGTPIETWMPAYLFDQSPNLKKEREAYMVHIQKILEIWKRTDWDKWLAEKTERWEENGKKGGKPKPKSHPLDPVYPTYPSTLFNAMLAPVIPYAIRGFIWYQGESNVGPSAPLYEEQLTMMINAWRKEWKNDKLPFYIVQLANFKSKKKAQGLDDPWATVMDAQRRVATKLPNTGLSVTIDIGDPNNIHPRNKIDVGRRLALRALKNEYGMKIPECSGPLYKSCLFTDEKAVVSFTHTGSGLMVAEKNGIEPPVKVDKPLTLFEIEDSNGKWHKAVAKINGDKIEVSSTKVTEPTAVRYAWSCNPEGAKLYNIEGLPASPFTTSQ